MTTKDCTPMIHLHFPSVEHFNRFLANPLEYQEETHAATILPFVGKSPIESAVDDLKRVAKAVEGTIKRGPGRPRKDASTAQPAVAVGNSGSPSTGSQAAPPPVSDVAVPVETIPADVAPVAPAAVSTESVTIDHVRKALGDYNLKFQMEKTRDLLKSFGANRISELTADKWEGFVAAVHKAVA